MTGLRWKVDRAQLVIRAVRQAAVEGLGDAVEFLGDEADRTAPIEEGTLIRSRTSTVDPGRLVGVVAYNTPYAVRQHEELTYRHNEGRRAKWLEAAFTEQGRTAVDHIHARMRKALR